MEKIKCTVKKPFNGHAEGDTIELKPNHFTALSAKGMVEKKAARKSTSTKEEKTETSNKKATTRKRTTKAK